jgi:surface protein
MEEKKIIFKNVNLLESIESKYILKQIFDNLHQINFLNLIRYNKNFQKALDISIKDFKNCSNIEIEIYISEFNFGNNNTFINITDKDYCHIFFNDNKEEIKRNYLEDNEKVTKIKITLDNEIKYLNGLFNYCTCIKKINFIRFNIRDIYNMSGMFWDCKGLEELNISKFKTDKVTNMSYMFAGCSFLRKLDFFHSRTNKVTDMKNMFLNCKLLKELNLSNLITDNVTDMDGMFCGCFQLKKLNLSNFKTNKVNSFHCMFDGCESLEELDLSNFSINNVTNMNCMFNKCLSLKKLSFPNFHINKETSTDYMFDGCNLLIENEEWKKTIKKVKSHQNGGKCLSF